jgi:phage repressor protein C with HTH and peptisase S24 domain
MGWAALYISALKAGNAVQFRPRGNSMVGKIESGQLVTVVPLDSTLPVKDDIVLCRVNGNDYLHLVKAVNGARYQIGNNRGGINGWVTINQIFGRCTKVEA